MKNMIKRAAVMLLSAMLAVPAVSAVAMPEMQTVEAAKAKKLSVYAAETYAFGATSIKSDNKKIAKAVKNANGTYDLVGVKKGTANITVKGGFGAGKYKVTVKDNKTSVKLSKMGDSAVLFTVKNGSKQTFDEVVIKYTIKDKSKKTLYKETQAISGVMAGKTYYAWVDLKAGETVNVKKSSVSISSLSYRSDFKYTNVTDKVKVSVDDNEKELQTDVHVKIETDYDQTISGHVYLVLRDASNKIVGVKDISRSLKKGNVQNINEKIYPKKVPGYTHYSIEYSYYTATQK